MTKAVEELRSHVESEEEDLKRVLRTNSDEVSMRLESTSSELRQRLYALNALTTRCLDVNGLLYILF